MLYFSKKIDTNLQKIYLHRIITAVTVQLAGIFSIIFLYQFFGDSYRTVIVLYIVLGTATIFSLPLVGYFINRFSYKTSLIIGATFRTMLWLSYFIAALYDWKYAIILIFVSLLGIRVFYWVPYKTDFMTFRKDSDHGKSVSVLESIQNIVGIFSPVLAGFILTTYSYNVLYAVGLAFLFVAIWPLKNISRIENSFTWNYSKVFLEIFNKKNRDFVTASFFNGLESMITFIWPIFIFEILKGDYLKIGSIVTATTIMVVLFNLFVGKYVDTTRSEKSFLKYGTILTSIAWLVKIFVTTATHIFVIDIYHRISSAIYGVSYQSLVYGYQLERGKLKDEYALLSELSFRIGQTLSGIILFSLSFMLPMNYFFVIAAIAVLLMNVIPNRNI